MIFSSGERNDFLFVLLGLNRCMMNNCFNCGLFNIILGYRGCYIFFHILLLTHRCCHFY